MDNGFINTLRYSGFFRGEPRVIGGVCQGLAQRYGWELNSVRILTVITAIFFPVTCIAYAFAWVLLPESRDGRIHVDEMLKGRFDSAIIGASILAIFGGGALGVSSIVFTVPALILYPVVFIVAAMFLKKSRQTHTPPTTPPSSAQAGEADQPAPDWRTQGGPQQSSGSPFAAFSSSPSGSVPPPASSTSQHSVPTTAGRRFAPVVSEPPLLPRRLSHAGVLCVYGLVMLVLAGTFWFMYDSGFRTSVAAQRWLQIGLIGGGICLVIVGLAHLIAALRDRSSAALSVLSIIGMMLAIPAGLGGVGYAAVSTGGVWHWQSTSSGAYSENWQANEIGNPTGSEVITLDLDLSHAPDGLTKDIHVRASVLPAVNIQTREGQSVRIVTQKRPIVVNIDGNGDATWGDFRGNSPSILTSPNWSEGNGITVYLDTQQAVSVNIEETGKFVDRDPLPSPTPSPAATTIPTPAPSASVQQGTPTPSPVSSQSSTGNEH